jgi:hypothetical protein
MDATERLRERAVRLLAMAMQVRDLYPGYADKLVAEAIELEERAKAMEGGWRAKRSSNPESSPGMQFGALPSVMLTAEGRLSGW